MKKSIKRSDIGEETIFFLDCPYCEELNETMEDPTDLEEFDCQHCKKTFGIEDDEY